MWPPLPHHSFFLKLYSLRWPLIIFSFILISYGVWHTLVSVPYLADPNLSISWREEGLIVLEDSPLTSLKKGDLILSINEIPVVYHRDPSYPEHRAGDAIAYNIERQGVQQEVLVPTIAHPTWSMRLERTIFGIVALAIWFTILPIAVVARPQNHLAWKVWFFLYLNSLALVLLGSYSSNSGGRTIYNLVVPFATWGFVSLASLHFTPALKSKDKISWVVTRFFFTATVLFAIITIVELSYFYPYERFLIFRSLGNITYTHLINYFLILGLLCHPIILIIRYFSYHPRQPTQLILAVFLFIGAFPSCISVVTRTPLINLVVTVSFLLFIPLSYGFILFRYNYLQLDFFVTKGLVGLLTGGVFVIIYLAYFHLATLWLNVHTLSAEQTIIPLFLSVITLFSFQFIGGRRLFNYAIEKLLYGTFTVDTSFLNEITTRLSHDPERNTILTALHQILDHLQIREGQLWLYDENGKPTTVWVSHCEPVPFPSSSLLSSTQPFFLRNTIEQDEPELIQQLPSWAAILFPLVNKQQRIGVLSLSAPYPDGIFHALHIQFLQKCLEFISLTWESVRMFETSLQLSSQLQLIRAQERNRLATELHDDTLQNLSLVMQGLEFAIQDVRDPSSSLQQKLRHAQQSIKGCLQTLRAICSELRPPLMYQGLQWMLEDIIYTSQQKSADLRITLSVEAPSNYILPLTHSEALYHIVYETLTNARKHARASLVQVVAKLSDEQQLQITIQDDGVGLPIETISLPELLRHGHFGLAGMYSWALTINAQLALKNSTPSGLLTTITVFVG